MTIDEAEDILCDFITTLADADNFPEKPSYQQDKQEFRQRMVYALQFAPKTIFFACDGESELFG